MSLREWFDYEPDTGFLRWKRQPEYPKQWNTRYAGNRVGGPHKDGIKTKWRGKNHSVHTLIWGWMTGSLPPEGHGIDHKDGNNTNNRWDNLRLATSAENNRNSRARGEWPKGVYKNRRGTFIAQIKYGGINHYLGSFRTPDEARKAYKTEADRVFGEFACTER